jgi:N4-gp56 family major capsid protein
MSIGPINSSNDISPRTNGYAVADLIKRAQPLLTIEKFMQAKVLPSNSTKVMKFRQYNPLPLATVPLTEGVTPSGRTLTYRDVETRLTQFGDYVAVSDVIQDTHEDPVFTEARQLIAEQSAQTLEAIRFGVLKAGTNVYYGNGSDRSTVNTPLTLALQRKITRGFKRNLATPFSSVMSSSVQYGTQAVESAYIALVHPDMEYVVRGLAGFRHVKDYGQGPVFEGEIGAVESVRYIASTVFESWADAGGAVGTNISTAGTASDVYPVIFLARDAAATVALKGQNALSLIVKNLGSGGTNDPLNQRATVGWKTMTTGIILQQLFMARAEVAIPEIS